MIYIELISIIKIWEDFSFYIFMLNISRDWDDFGDKNRELEHFL